MAVSAGRRPGSSQTRAQEAAAAAPAPAPARNVSPGGGGGAARPGPRLPGGRPPRRRPRRCRCRAAGTRRGRCCPRPRQPFPLVSRAARELRARRGGGGERH